MTETDSRALRREHNRKVMKRRRILKLLILFFIILTGAMMTGLINSGIKAYNISQMTPTPEPTMFARRTPTPTPGITITPTPGPVVMIDAGHGGFDPGNVVKDTDLVSDIESELNLKISTKVKEKLEALGFTVLTTREEDVYVSLKDRADMYMSSEATAFVSIHLNSFGDQGVSGCEVYYYSGGNENAPFLAECIVNGICDSTGARNRGAKKNDFEVTLTAKASVLAECGYMTNPGELEQLKNEEYQDLLAQGIADGLVKYYKKTNGAKKRDE